MKNLLFVTLLFLFILPAFAQKKSQKPSIGIAESLSRDSLLNEVGYNCLVESVQKLFSPQKVSEEQFKVNLETIRKLKVSLYAVNIFIPSELKLVGPKVDEDSILAYSRVILKRAQSAKVKMIVWGSGGARRIPEGFDPLKAKDQFVSIARKVATIAKEYNVVIALENLNSTETNFINTLEEAYDVASKVNHPNFRICADIYHMLKENESSTVIEKANQYIVHCDIAEKEGRTPPGTNGDDFKPYLTALKKIGYNGKIILECRWEDIAKQAKPSYQYLQRQLNEVYSQ